MSFCEVFVGKSAPVNALKSIDDGFFFSIKEHLSAGSIASSEIAALSHKVRNDSVEARTLVSKASLASAQLTEVLCAFWGHIIVELQNYMFDELS